MSKKINWPKGKTNFTKCVANTEIQHNQLINKKMPCHTTKVENVTDHKDNGDDTDDVEDDGGRRY